MQLKRIFKNASALQEPENSGPENSGPQKMLHFHTLFGEEFSGESAQEVMKQLYESSRSGMGDISFDQWWEYQSSLWKGKYRLTTPKPDKPGAHEKLLDTMVKVGALEKGKLPDSLKDNKRNATHG